MTCGGSGVTCGGSGVTCGGSGVGGRGAGTTCGGSGVGGRGAGTTCGGAGVGSRGAASGSVSVGAKDVTRSGGRAGSNRVSGFQRGTGGACGTVARVGGAEAGGTEVVGAEAGVADVVGADAGRSSPESDRDGGRLVVSTLSRVPGLHRVSVFGVTGAEGFRAPCRAPNGQFGVSAALKSGWGSIPLRTPVSWSELRSAALPRCAPRCALLASPANEYPVLRAPRT